MWLENFGILEIDKIVFFLQETCAAQSQMLAQYFLKILNVGSISFNKHEVEFVVISQLKESELL